ncbi:MAG: hypothetical protein DME50_14900 [Verrucomicrobia bacterium]|nr:MAG: hypothetical protein DME85_01900 [Verrucomicrobiota bacterium]PYK64201.1 MAG: hypothetical protein DME50_14900 [Verrucomicrobiota bacterium]
MRTKCCATKADNEKGDDFWHKERVLSVIFEPSASDFFKNRNFFCGPCRMGAGSLQPWVASGLPMALEGYSVETNAIIR